MPYGSSNPGPSEDMFSDSPDSMTKEARDEGMEEEGVLPKSLMAGKKFKVGEEIVLEITRIGEQDFSVRYATEKGKKEGSEEEEAGESPAEERAEMAGNSERESMMY